MSGGENGVVVYRATRIGMIEAVREAVPGTPKRGLRKARPVDHAAVVDAILEFLPEAEPSSLKALDVAEAIIAERDSTIDSQAAIIQGLQDATADLRAERDEKASLIGQADREITRLRSDVAVKDTKLAESKRKVVDLRKQADRAAKIRDQDAASLAAERERADHAEGVAGDLRAQITELNVSATEAMPGGIAATEKYVDELIGRAESAEQSLAAVVPVLEQFAAPGAWTSTKRQQAATEALRAAQGHAEVVAP